MPKYEQEKYEYKHSEAIFIAWWWIFCIIMIIRSFWNRGQ